MIIWKLERGKTMKSDTVIAIKDNNGNFFCSFEHYDKYWNKQIRKAKFYRSEDWAKSAMNDIRICEIVTHLVKVKIEEIDD